MFTADYLEKVVEPCDWLALWSTDVFDVLVEVRSTFRHVSVNTVNVAVLSPHMAHIQSQVRTGNRSPQTT